MVFRSKKKKTAFIGIGANLGPRTENIKKALSCLSDKKEIRVERVSSFRETKPVDGPGPDYLNGVAKVITTFSPRRLLEELQAIEAKLGRRRTFKNSPRVIDLDILLYEDERIDEPGLNIPHPKMMEREFVIGPLSEIEPGFRKYVSY